MQVIRFSLSILIDGSDSPMELIILFHLLDLGYEGSIDCNIDSTID